MFYYAFINTKNMYSSIFGERKSLENIYYKESEFSKEKWSLFKYVKLISDIIFIKLPISAPSWVPKYLKVLLFGENSKYIPNKREIDTEGTCIIYINGIMSNEEVVKSNQRQIEYLIKRPVNIIHNVTDSVLMDLIECLIGKETDDLTEASTISLYTISNKLLDDNIKKLVIICYSQGTIIIAKVLSSLARLGLNKKKYLEKLEIYAFACCASRMNYLMDELPYMEHFANDNDFVAKLGCNIPIEIKSMVSIDGKKFIAKNRSGHMLNEHYLNNFKVNFPDSKLNYYL